MEKIITDGFIRVYNKMINDDSEYRVTPEELYVYSILFINRRQDESILTSVGMIEATMSEKAMLSNRQATNRQKIKEALVGLVNKKVLFMTCDTSIEQIKTNTFIIAKINDNKLCKDSDSDTFNGYEELQIENFKMMLSSQELMIYILSQRFSNDGGFKASYDRLAKLLNVSRNTAVKLINAAEESKIITIKRGRHVSKNRQEINYYFSVDFTKDYTDVVDKHEEEDKVEQTKEETQSKAPKSNVVAFGTAKDKVDVADEIGDSLPF